MSNWESKQSKEDKYNEPFVGDLDGIEQNAKGQGSDQQNTKEEKTFEKMTKKANWEQKLIHSLAFEAIKEQRAKRRWGIFFKFAFLAYVLVISVALLYPIDPDMENLNQKHTALINVEGVIASDSEASADKIVSSLRDAFKDEKTKGIILRMNTPGGSPVQSGYINDEIYRLKAKYPGIPIYAVISDVCASGGYYIAAATDAIYADKASIVGSIGVIMNGFGFVDAMKKLGVSRRLYTSGEHKAFLDPFSPQNEVEVQHVNSMLKNIHEQFISVVKKGRKDKLSSEPELFSGYFWTGEKALEIGLVDELGSPGYVAREVIGAEKIKEFIHKDDLIERFSKHLGASISSTFMDTLKSINFDLQ